MSGKPNRPSLYARGDDGIKSLDDLLIDVDRRRDFLNLFSTIEYDIKPNEVYRYPVKSLEDEKVLLLQDLGIIDDADWNALAGQHWRDFSNRLLTITVQTNNVIKIYDKINGRGGILQKANIELIAKKIAETNMGEGLLEYMRDWGVPVMLYGNRDALWENIFTILAFYSTADKKENQDKLFTIIENMLNPLMHGGDKKKADEFKKAMERLLKFDGYGFDQKNKILKKDETQKIITTKARRSKIFISKEYGIYKDEKTREPKYAIRGRRAGYLWKLKEVKQSGSALSSNLKLLSKEIAEINTNFKKNLNLNDDLIVHLPTGGYQLNNEKFDIKFIDTDSGC